MSKAKHERQPVKHTARVRCALRLVAEFWLTALLVLASSAFAYAQGPRETRYGEALHDLDVEAVRQALKAGADPNERYGGKGPSPIYRATGALIWSRKDGKLPQEVEEKVIAVLEELFKAGAVVRSYDEGILAAPTITGAGLVAKYLLDRGANPNGEESKGGTPVVYAIKYGHPDMVNLLIEYGAKPLDAVTSAQIRFIEAARNGDLIAMRREMQNGAKVNTRSPIEETALVAAVEGGQFRGGNFKVISELLRLGADPNLQGGWHHTALHTVVFAKEDSFEEDNGPAIMKALLKAGAHVSSTANSFAGEVTPLHIAARLQNAKAVRILLEAGAKVMPRDADGKTPLDYAEAGPVIELLKSYGAKESP